MDLPAPGPLFNLITQGGSLSPDEFRWVVFAGPFGLVGFLPLVPIVLLIARGRRPRGADTAKLGRAALIGGALVWMVATLQYRATLVLLGGLAAAAAWVVGLGALRRRGRLGERGMIALVWIGLHVLILPLWWKAQQPWYPSPMAVLHYAGFAYLLLRLIAWGVDVARNPGLPLRLVDTICWLLYPPCMRLGPVMLREPFLERLDAWDPRRSPALRAGAKRFALFALGVGGIALGARGWGWVTSAGDFFAHPEACSTAQLAAGVYLVAIQTYLLLWTYNELAAALALWIGIPVDNNFDWVPLATSIRDFWRRWHITLGTWLRNYVYIPLGGNRRHVALNYGAVFGYCGLWHGASWSFLAWAAMQTVALTVQRGWDRWRGYAGGPRRTPVHWTALCWLLTMHFQIATILVFCDFEHLGLRVFRELLWRRCLAGVFTG